MKSDRADTRSAAGRLAEVDGLRALAILAVMVHHGFAPFPVPAVRAVATFGWAGVDLFFVISGFLIGGILMDHREAVNYYRVFYIRRFFRIVPVYAVVLAPALLVALFGGQAFFKGHSLAEETGPAIWLHVLFLQNFGSALLLAPGPRYLAPTWSLAVEEQFYLLMPTVIRHLAPRRLPTVMLVAVLAAPVLRGALWLLFGAQATVACYVLLPCRWDALLLGVLCAYAVREATWRGRISANLSALRFGWIFLAAGMLGMIAVQLDRSDPSMQIAGYTWIAAFFAFTLLLATLNPPGALCRLLRARWLKPVATVSYAMYLFHPIVTAVVFRFCFGGAHAEAGWKEMAASLLAMLGTGAVAWVSWRLLESKMIRRGHRQVYKPPVLPQTAPQPQ